MSSNSSQNCCSSPDGSRSYPSAPNNQFATGLGPPISSPSASATSGRNNLNNANRSTVPETKKDNKYWERRRRNNEAARRSREKRRQNDLVLDQRIGEVTIRNRELEQEILQLRYQLNSITKDCGTPVTNVGTTISSVSKSNQSTYVNCNNIKSSSSSPNNCANNNVVLPIFTTMDHDKQASLLLLTSPTISSSTKEEIHASNMSITNSNISPPINNNNNNNINNNRNNNNKCVNNPTNILTLSSIPLLSNLLTAAQFTTSISSKLESIPLSSSASVSSVAVSGTVCSTSIITNSSNSITNSSTGNVISSSLSDPTSNLTSLVSNHIVSSAPFFNKNTDTIKDNMCEINSISSGNMRKRKRKYDNQDILDLRIKPEKMANIFNENESETPVYNEDSQSVIGNNSFLTGITAKLSHNSNSPNSHISTDSSDSSDSTFVPVSPSPTSSALSFTPSKLCTPQISNETEAFQMANHTILSKQSNSVTDGNVDDNSIKQIHLSNNPNNQSKQEDDVNDKTKSSIKERRSRRIKRNQCPTNPYRPKWSYSPNVTQLLHHQIRSTLSKHKQEINSSLDNLKQQMGDMKSLLLQIIQPAPPPPPPTTTTTTYDDNNNNNDNINNNINDNTINVDNNYGNHSYK